MVSGCSGVQTSHEKTQICVEGDRNLVFRWSPLDVSTGGGRSPREQVWTGLQWWRQLQGGSPGLMSGGREGGGVSPHVWCLGEGDPTIWLCDLWCMWCTLPSSLPLPCGQTDAYENITLLQIRLQVVTRMHSSRMRTVRCSGCPWGCLPRGWGICPGGVCPGWLPATPPPLWTEWQTHVKTLPCRNYIADGNKSEHVPGEGAGPCTMLSDLLLVFFTWQPNVSTITCAYFFQQYTYTAHTDHFQFSWYIAGHIWYDARQDGFPEYTILLMQPITVKLLSNSFSLFCVLFNKPHFISPVEKFVWTVVSRCVVEFLMVVCGVAQCFH